MIGINNFIIVEVKGYNNIFSYKVFKDLLDFKRENINIVIYLFWVLCFEYLI